MIRRIVDHLRRIRNARRFGIPFYRRAALKMPAHVRVGARDIPLAYPQESGVRNDLVTCFIDDEYGLWSSNFEARSVADIGANMGFFSVAARARYPDCTIHAYEPNPRVVPYLSSNAAPARVTVFAEAVGAADGFVHIADDVNSNQARTVDAGSAGIRQVSLAEVVRRLGGRIDLAKIDCEGAEWDMFTAPEPWRSIRALRMEYHLWGQRSFSDVQRALEGLGFDIHRHNSSDGFGTVWARNRASNA